MTDEYIIGFHSGHDCSYAVLKNGIPIIHEEYERFTRIKEGNGDGLKFCFEHARDIFNETSNFTHAYHYPDVRELGDTKLFDIMLEKANKGKTYYEISHHLAHAAHAHYSNNKERSLIIVIDAGGWNMFKSAPINSSVSVWRGENNQILPVELFNINEFDIGGLWSDCLGPIFGLSSGSPVGNQAGTVMAMAAVGTEYAFCDDIYECFLNPSNKKVLFAKMEKYIFENPENKYNVAKGIQEATEQMVEALLSRFLKPDDEHVCLSGGVALNSVCVGKIMDWFPSVASVFVPIAPYDGGLSLGSAQYMYHAIQNNPLFLNKDYISPYLGRSYTKEEVIAAIDKNNNSLIAVNDIRDIDVIKALMDSKIVSIFNGKSESGRRALGNRSIVADPRNSNMKNMINEKVKHRQWFRPFAPSILEEEVKNWFVKDVSSPYMGTVISFKEEVKSKVPAVVHIDGTGRLQSVTEKINPWYYGLLKLWQENTGVPILLNTSFNDREPIVETPEDAITCFLKTNIDYLYFPEFGILVKKRET